MKLKYIKLLEEMEVEYPVDISLVKDVKKKEIKEKLINFFKKNKTVTDEMVHNLADDMKIEHSELETYIYGLLTSFFYFGRYNENTKETVDKDELDMGIKVEMEHTDCPLIAERIALDHLAEIKDYYSRLAKMEGQ